MILKQTVTIPRGVVSAGTNHNPNKGGLYDAM
jgi:hypothetical protein